MRRSAPPVLGISAPAVRPTFRGALWLACLISVPVFAVLTLGEALWHLIF